MRHLIVSVGCVVCPISTPAPPARPAPAAADDALDAEPGDEAVDLPRCHALGGDGDLLAAVQDATLQLRYSVPGRAAIRGGIYGDERDCMPWREGLEKQASI
jgi:hypothetical protein